MTTPPPNWRSTPSARGEGMPRWPSQPSGVSPAEYMPASTGDVPRPGGGRRDWRIPVMTVAIAGLLVAGALVYVLGNQVAQRKELLVSGRWAP